LSKRPQSKTRVNREPNPRVPQTSFHKETLPTSRPTRLPELQGSDIS
jgi:hypothetical protein